MLDSSLAFYPAWQLAEMMRTKQISPIELVDLCIDRIEKLNPKFSAFITVDAEHARATARKAESDLLSGDTLPPLFGVPVSVKDLYPTKGMRTTYGSLAFRDHIPDQDSLAVTRIRTAGAIILGKTNTPEFGQSATTENALGDACRNPWNPDRTAGGSSGGAAVAVAAGLGPLALASDGGGSARIPAAFCGVVGFKPTFGRVPMAGGMGGMPLFAHCGAITRTVRDAALMIDVLSGFDPSDPRAIHEPQPVLAPTLRGDPSTALSGMRVAWSKDLGYAAIDPEVAQLTEAAAKQITQFGCALEEATPASGRPFGIFGPIICADEYAAIGYLLEHHDAELMPYVRATLEHGMVIMGFEYSRALRGLEVFRAQMADFFDHFDLLLTPTTAVPAFPIGQRPEVIDGREVDRLWGSFPFLTSFNLTGNPAISIPVGFNHEGLPVGLQIVGRLGDDPRVLQAAAAFEVAHPWASSQPPSAA